MLRRGPCWEDLLSPLLLARAPGPTAASGDSQFSPKLLSDPRLNPGKDLGHDCKGAIEEHAPGLPLPAWEEECVPPATAERVAMLGS